MPLQHYVKEAAGPLGPARLREALRLQCERRACVLSLPAACPTPARELPALPARTHAVLCS